MIILINGKIGSGKDCLANLIMKNSKMKYEKIKFANSLKECVSLLTNTPLIKDESGCGDFTQEQKNYKHPLFDKTIGELLQIVGDGFRKFIKDDIWITSLLSRVDINKNYIITDTRYKNEINAFTNMNIDVVSIRINGDPLNVRCNSKRLLNHASEIDLDDYTNFDYVIENNGSLSDLEEEVRMILGKIECKLKKN